MALAAKIPPRHFPIVVRCAFGQFRRSIELQQASVDAVFGPDGEVELGSELESGI